MYKEMIHYLSYKHTHVSCSFRASGPQSLCTSVEMWAHELSWDVSHTVFPETLGVAASFAVLLASCCPGNGSATPERQTWVSMFNKPSSLTLQDVMGFFKSLTSFAALLGTNPAVLRPESETKKNKTSESELHPAVLISDPSVTITYY